jgi:helix-turn-helix protein
VRHTGQPFNPFRLFFGVFVPEALLRFSRLSAGAKLCYGLLCRYAGEKGWCWPSQRQLAEALGGISVRNTRRYLQELESEKFIRVIQVGLQRNNKYEFLWHEVFEGSERTDLSSQDRTGWSSPGRTRVAGPSEKESLKESVARTANPTPPPPLLTKGGAKIFHPNNRHNTRTIPSRCCDRWPCLANLGSARCKGHPSPSKRCGTTTGNPETSKWRDQEST